MKWLPPLALASSIVVGCTMKKQEAPPLTGPSEFGTAITISVTPDVLTQDGASQSLITITAREANGAPARNLSLRVETFVNGQPVDVGTLSARTVVTNNEGRATLTFTAPAGVVGGTESLITIGVTPIGGDINNAATRTSTVRLVPPGVILPPAGLTPAFTVSPATPAEDTAVLFDASTSTSTNGIESYRWTFGDGSTGSGVTFTKTFADPGNFPVTLTITDPFGRSASTTRNVTVSQGANPSASFVFSPDAPRVNEQVHFNAMASQAAAGRRIVGYTWDFGDGVVSEAGPLVGHTYTAARTYNVTLTVTDDAGRTGSVTNSVTISAASNP